jgi:hypothetical protein
MLEETLKVLKKEIGYTEIKPVECKTCHHCIEKDGFLDREKHHQCTLFQVTLGSFTVDGSARCEKHTPKRK